MIVEITINTDNLKEAMEIASVLQNIASNLSPKDFAFFKKNNINWKKLSEKAQKNPMLLKLI